MTRTRDYYKILEINKNATPGDIKKAYHKLSLKHHPDRKGGSKEKFQEINEAYSVLSDQTKRSNYDANPSSYHEEPIYNNEDDWKDFYDQKHAEYTEERIRLTKARFNYWVKPEKDIDPSLWSPYKNWEEKARTLHDEEWNNFFSQVWKLFEEAELKNRKKYEEELKNNEENAKKETKLRHQISKQIIDLCFSSSMTTYDLDPNLWSPYKDLSDKIWEMEIEKLEDFKKQVFSAIEKESLKNQKYDYNRNENNHNENTTIKQNKIADEIFKKFDSEKVYSIDLNASIWKPCKAWTEKLISLTNDQQLNEFKDQMFREIEKVKINKKKNNNDNNSPNDKEDPIKNDGKNPLPPQKPVPQKNPTIDPNSQDLKNNLSWDKVGGYIIYFAPIIIVIIGALIVITLRKNNLKRVKKITIKIRFFTRSVENFWEEIRMKKETTYFYSEFDFRNLNGEYDDIKWIKRKNLKN